MSFERENLHVRWRGVVFVIRKGGSRTLHRAKQDLPVGEGNETCGRSAFYTVTQSAI